MNVLHLIITHKKLSIISILLLGGGIFFGVRAYRSTPEQTQYILAAAQKETLITSISGSGQVAVSDQVDVKAKTSGQVIHVAAVAGQTVKTGEILATLDTSDAQKTVRDAADALESAKLSLEKLQQPKDALSVLQAEHSLAQARESKQDAERSLVKAYEDGFTAVSNAFLDIPSVMAGLDSIFFDSTINAGASGQWNIDWYVNQVPLDDRDRVMVYRDDTSAAYIQARKEYQESFATYKVTSRSSDPATIETLVDTAYNTIRRISDTIKAANNYIDYVQDVLEQTDVDIPSVVQTHQSDLDQYTGTINQHLSSLLSIQQSFDSTRKTIVNADRTIAERTASYDTLDDGPDALDVRTQEMTIRQREQSLADAREALADYTVRAPFDGVIAAVNVRKGEEVSSGTAAATVITKQRIAEISLNEIDAAKVKVGQKATLTFDAVEDLTLTGEVISMDTLGTVSQGVVSYTVTIGFDTQDERVRPGMTVSASIITDIRPDALVVPNSSIKTQGESQYVELPGEVIESSPAANSTGIVLTQPIRQQSVTTGLSNDTMTEITVGLTVGDHVIVRTIMPSAQKTTQTAAPSLFSGTGGAGSNASFRAIR